MATESQPAAASPSGTTRSAEAWLALPAARRRRCAAGRLGLVRPLRPELGQRQRHRRNHPGHHGQRSPAAAEGATNQDNVLATENPIARARPARPQDGRSTPARRHPHPRPSPPSPPRSPTKPRLRRRSIRSPPNSAQQGTTGEAAASIPMSSTQTQAGTFSVGQSGRRLRHSLRLLHRADQAEGRIAVVPQHARPAGPGPSRLHHLPGRARRLPSHIQIAQRSGDATLDQTALNAVRHIDTFGPLPDAYSGSHINVTYYFDPPPRH